jgi:Cu/Ag efflux protein CusF
MGDKYKMKIPFGTQWRMKTLTLILCCAPSLLAQGNTAAPTSGQTARPIGMILAIDSAARRITIKIDAGPEMNISFEETTRFLRVAPGAKDLENATPISASELSAGDRILARGRSASDPTLFAATSIIVISKADLARKHAAERAEWEKRGVGGVITALDPAAKEITITVPTTAGAKPMVIAFAPGAALRRYAPNSVKFSDARPSRFEELKIGDQVRALGNSNEDRSRYTAEELVSGSFRAIAAVVVSHDAAQNTILVTDLAANKRMEARLTPDSIARRLSAEVVHMLAARNKEGSAPDQGPRELQPLIERLPHLSVADIKAGDAVIISFANSEDVSRVTAITLLAGVEPLLKTSTRGGQSVNLGSWNLDLNMNVGVP